MKTSTPILSSRALNANSNANAPQRPVMPSAPALRTVQRCCKAAMRPRS